ncbi:MAG: YceH family protein [Elusimicrobia bacterium]|nr:YceH family protein [Elusimicrobiota bacterium]
MLIELTEIEARVLGSLVEKALTTPEQYPLSYNALLNACNQKTSRDPVMQLDETVLGKGLHGLLQKGLAERCQEPGSRVPRFGHRIHVLLQSEDPKQIGAMTILLLRGPQTPGEIKNRSERLCSFASTVEVDAMLQEFAARSDGALVSKLPRQPGQKEARYRHLFCPASPEHAAAPSPAGPAALAGPAKAEPSSDRLAALEKRVEALEAGLAQLAKRPPA